MISFEEQFKNKIKVKTLGGLIDIIDIKPNKVENKNPIFFSSGWASTPELLEPLLKSISKNGRRIVAIDFENLNYTKKRYDGYEAREDLKARTILDVLEKLNIEKVDIIGHSEGAVNSTLAVEINPAKFNSLLLVAPAGMIENDSFINLTFRFLKTLFIWPLRKIKGTSRPFYHIIQNIKFILFNPMQSFGESYGLSKIQIGVKVKKIIEKGIVVNLIYFKNDVVFPFKPVRKTADENNIPVHTTEGTHNDIYSKPDVFWEKVKGFFE